MTEPSTSYVEQQIAARIAAARVKVAAAQKLRHLAEAEQRRKGDEDDLDDGQDDEVFTEVRENPSGQDDEQHDQSEGGG